MEIANNLLFNFAASYSSGGYKRLYEYARWFDAQGGAAFAIHPRCEALQQEFPRNRYFIARQSRLERLFTDGRYLADIVAAHGQPDLHYSYGIPLYRPVGRIDWFHLSNVLPMLAWSAPLTLADRVKFSLLGRRMRAGFSIAQVISAESHSSLETLPQAYVAKGFVSVNGSDDELASIAKRRAGAADDIAVVVGTYRYKALDDSLRVFEELRAAHPALSLHIFGNPAWIPESVRRAPHVVIHGNVERAELIGHLSRARFYISTTRVENSYNAASEGVFLAEQSHVSDIGPHRELLAGSPVGRMRIEGVDRQLLHVRRGELDAANLKTWDTVIREMLARHAAALREITS